MPIPVLGMAVGALMRSMMPKMLGAAGKMLGGGGEGESGGIRKMLLDLTGRKDRPPGQGGGGALSGNVGKASKGIAGLGLVAATAVMVLSRWNTKVVEAAKELGTWNAGIATASASLDAKRIGRKMEMAAQTSGTTIKAIEAENRKEEAFHKFRAAGTNIKNTVTAFGANAFAALAEAAQKIPVFKQLLNWLANEEGKELQETYLDFLQDIADGKLDQRRQNRLGEGRILKIGRERVGPQAGGAAPAPWDRWRAALAGGGHR